MKAGQGFDRDRVSIDGRNEQTLDQFGGNLRMRWDLGRVSLHSITGYESVETYSRGDIDGGSVYAFPTGALGVALGVAFFPGLHAQTLGLGQGFGNDFLGFGRSFGPQAFPEAGLDLFQLFGRTVGF